MADAALDGSIAQQQQAMARGECSAAGVFEAALQRIAALDAAGPTLPSMIEINPDALAISEALDRARLGAVRSSLNP